MGHTSLKNPSFKKDFKDEKPLTRKRVNFEDNNDAVKNDTSKVNSNNNNEENTDKEDKNLRLDVELGDGKSLSVTSLASLTENIGYIDEGRDITDRTSMATDIVNEIIQTIGTGPDEMLDNNNHSPDSKGVVKDAVFADVHIQNIIKKFDEQKQESPKSVPAKPKAFPRSVVNKPPGAPQRPDVHKKPVVPVRNPNTKLRGRLDKSYSTPAYDLTPDDCNAEKFVVESKKTGKQCLN